MTFVSEVLRDKPLGLWLLSDDSPFQDYSGYGRAASSPTAPERHLPLVRGASFASIFNNTNVAKFSSPLFTQGYESQGFTLEAVFRIIPSSDTRGEQQVLGHLSGYDGIIVNGREISFVTKYQNSGESRVTVTLSEEMTAHVVAVHTKEKNMLYVNGSLAGEVDVTEAQQNDRFISTDGFLYSGRTSSGGSVALNAVAIYSSAFDLNLALSHYYSAIVSFTPEDIVSGNSGSTLSLGLSAADIFQAQQWVSDADWWLGDANGVSIADGMVMPLEEDGISIAGYWTDTFVLDYGSESIYGVVPMWEGIGASVEVSLDGESWSAIKSGVKVDLIPEGFDPEGKSLAIRVSFSGGIEDDPSYISNLRFFGIGSNRYLSSTREIVMTNTTPLDNHLPFELRDDWGVLVESGGSLTISPDQSPSPVNTRTLEVWIRRIGDNASISMTGTRYINGSAGSTLPLNRWVLMHIVSDSNVGDISFTGPVQIGSISLYPESKTAAQISQIFSQYTEANAMRVNDSTVVNVTESLAGPKIYAHDWSIQAAG